MRKRPSKFRPNPSSGAELPIAVSPSGRQIAPGGKLPELPLPRRVVVGRDALWVDGWVFRLVPFGRETMAWLASQAGRWCQDDPSPENKAQVMGVIDAVETLLKKGFDEDGPKQAEFKF